MHPWARTRGAVLSCAERGSAKRNCRLQRIAVHVTVRVPVSRLGISLTEVLIAMGILTVGLLGVASIFPVASFYMQKGDVADRGSAIAQAAFNEAASAAGCSIRRLGW